MEPVTVVTGLPRSGTSLMMQMLEAGGVPVLVDDLRPADESNRRGYFEFEPVKRTHVDASWVGQAVGRAVKVVHVLLPQLPGDYRYRVVFMKRDLDEVVRSQGVMLARLDGRGPPMSDAQLRSVYESQCAKMDAWLDEQPNFSVVTVDYNELIADPESVIPRLGQFLGGGLERELDLAAMRAVIDPDLYRQRGASM